jgi:hypothetical protein
MSEIETTRQSAECTAIISPRNEYAFGICGQALGRRWHRRFSALVRNGKKYHTSQASGIVGGRFIEIFKIPWPGVDYAWTCGDSLKRDPWPASRQLMFVNLILDSDDARVRENCGISEPLGKWVVENGRSLPTKNPN